MTNAVEKVDLVKIRTDAVSEFVMHHVQDSVLVKLPFDGIPIPFTDIVIPIAVTLHGVMLFATAIVMLLVFGLFYKKTDGAPRGITNLLEVFVLFIRDDVCIQYFGREMGLKMTPLFCSFFFFILFGNLLGLIPGLGAATGNLGVTLSLALISFFFMVFGAIYKNGFIGFLKGFVPRGVPLPVLFLLVPIEIISVGIKTAALAIRLFANIMAGHMVIFFMLGLLLILGVWGLPFVFVAFAIYIMEIFIALLQAYIFTLLSAVFIGERYHPEH